MKNLAIVFQKDKRQYTYENLDEFKKQAALFLVREWFDYEYYEKMENPKVYLYERRKVHPGAFKTFEDFLDGYITYPYRYRGVERKRTFRDWYIENFEEILEETHGTSFLKSIGLQKINTYLDLYLDSLETPPVSIEDAHEIIKQNQVRSLLISEDGHLHALHMLKAVSFDELFDLGFTLEPGILKRWKAQRLKALFAQ